MSRRASRRKAERRGRGGRNVGKWVVRMMSVLTCVVILAGFGLYTWLKSYLHSDDFRVFMGEAVGGVMGADARFELFEWQGMRANTAGLSVENGGVIRRMRADGVQADLGLAGVRRGVWEVSDVRVNKLGLVLDTTGRDGQSGAGAGDDAEGDAAHDGVAESTKPGFLEGLLPDRAELASLQVFSMNVDLKTPGGGLSATDVAARLDAGSGSAGYDVRLSGGVIDTSWFGCPLHLISARGKYKGGRIFLTESRSKVYKRGLLTLHGEVEGGDFGLLGALTDVRSEELVPEDWQKRITGDLTTRFNVRSAASGAITRGELELKNGVLTALPVLDRIAAYANTRRFRRLNLSEARLRYSRAGNRLELTDIVFASEGLVRVVGSLTVVDGRLDGRFRVGIMPGTLAHIPGAETKVFLRGERGEPSERGLLWSPLRITGTLDHPQEDLSNRMIAAAGERMFELVPETGKMALKFAHETATDLPQAVLDAGTDVLDEGAGVLDGGVDIIREGVGGLFDLIPGASGKDEK